MSLGFQLTSKKIELLVGSLYGLERSGHFEEGLLAISPDWAVETFLPETTGLSKEVASNLLLRFAALLGYQGHISKLKDSQLRARNILTNALENFRALNDEEHAAECENHIALTYWRAGEFQEADLWLDAASERKLPLSSRPALSTLMVRMIVNIGKHLYKENIDLFSDNEIAIRKYGDEMLKGSCHLNAGISLMELGKKNDALRCIELAKFYYETGGVDMYLGAVENELAHVYLSLGKYSQAHSAVDRGIEFFRQSGDQTREGFLFDTKSSIFLEEGKLDEAFRTVEKAIGILREAENTGFLAETYLTKAKILLKMDKFASAVSSLFEAVQLAKVNSGEAFGSKLIEQFEKSLNEHRGTSTDRDLPKQDIEAGELALVLPPSLASFDRVEAIWINNDHLACVGVRKGSLVVAVNDQVRKGDLVAVADMESGEVSCGFFDAEFGVVCLEGCDGEPVLFDQDAVRVIGKIAGFCSGEKDADGKLIVRPLSDTNLSEV